MNKSFTPESKQNNAVSFLKRLSSTRRLDVHMVQFPREKLLNSPRFKVSFNVKPGVRHRRSNSNESIRLKLNHHGIERELTDFQINQLRKRFQMLDTNQEGYVDENKVLKGFESFAIEDITQEDVSRMLQPTNKSRGQNKIDFFDFVCLMCQLDLLPELGSFSIDEEDSGKLFDILDTKNTGRLTEVELIERIEEITGQRYSLQQLSKMLSEIDEDSDGKIDKDEWNELMNYLAKKSSISD